MNTKNILVSFLAIVSVLFLVSTVSATNDGVYKITNMEINDVHIDSASVIAGETMKVEIWFTADFHLSHKNIIKNCNRPFKNVAEMDSILINNLKERIDPKEPV